MTYFKAFPARVPPWIDRSSVDGGGGDGSLPLMLKADQPATITINVGGLPAPVVRWYVGPTLVQTDRTPTVCVQSRDEEGRLSADRHSMTVERVSDELEQGVTVVASNDVGQDAVSLSVRTYKGGGISLTLPSSHTTSKTRVYQHHTLTEQDWINWHQQMEERSRMRSIDDIIDKLDTCSADDGAEAGESQSASQHPADAADQHSLRADTRQPTVGSDTFSLPARIQPRPASESTNAEPLWNMFGLPLPQLCRRLLTDASHEHRSAVVAKTRSVESRPAAKIEAVMTTQASKNVEVLQAPRVPVDGQSRMSSSRAGAGESNGHKPPLPTKPSLPPKPPIAKKPSLSKEMSAGLVRKPSSSSSSSCPPTSSTQSRQIRSTSSLQSDDSSFSAPTSPTAGVTQRDAGHYHHHQQQQDGGAVTTRSRSTDQTSPTSVSEKTKPTTTSDATERRSSPVRDRMKTTKSEEFLARIHRRSVSPVGTPRLMARGGRGRSVDLSAASDTSTSISRRTLSKEWAVVTTTTQEEVTVVYRPPTTSASDVVRVDTPTATSSIKSHGTVNNNVADSAGGRLYKTAIDNIRLSVSTDDSSTTKRTSSDASNEGVRSSSSDGDGGGRQSANSAHQLDDLISSLIEMAVEDAQPLQPPSMHHGVISTAAHY